MLPGAGVYNSDVVVVEVVAHRWVVAVVAAPRGDVVVRKNGGEPTQAAAKMRLPLLDVARNSPVAATSWSVIQHRDK
jgi:hypothetical protein